MIRIEPSFDGSWSVHREGRAIRVGLTRNQAERYGSMLAHRESNVRTLVPCRASHFLQRVMRIGMA